MKQILLIYVLMRKIMACKNSDFYYVFMGNLLQKKKFILNKCAISCKSCCVLIQKLCEILCKKSHFLQKRKLYGSPWTWQHKLGKRLRFIIFMFIGTEFAIRTARPHLFRWPFSCNIYIIQYFIFKKYKL